MLLYGKPVVTHLKSETKQWVSDNNLQGKYIAFFLLSENEASHVYVDKKCLYASDLGLHGQVFGRPDWKVEEALEMIAKCNRDANCIGIVVQIPLAPHLESYRATILSAVAPSKDLDGLGGILFWLSSIGKINFVPATPKAVLEILRFYHIDDFIGKTISVLGQSDLIGRPLSVELMKRGATVLCFNAQSDQALMREVCRRSHYIISATGVTHLVDETFIWPNRDQYIIDVGRGIEGGKAIGDTDWSELEDSVAGITPVPGGVGPVTVACLFHNLIALQQFSKDI